MKNRIKEFRKNANLSQSELAKKAEVSQQAIAKWESGKGKIPLPYRLAIAQAIGVNAERVFPSTVNSTRTVLTVRELIKKLKKANQNGFVRMGYDPELSVVGDVETIIITEKEVCVVPVDRLNKEEMKYLTKE